MEITAKVDCFFEKGVFTATTESEYHTEESQNVASIRLFAELSVSPKPVDVKNIVLLPVEERKDSFPACSNCKKLQLGFCLKKIA